jgi:hypothetical protein
MATTPKQDRPKFATEAIRSDVKSGVFLGNPILDNVVTCMIAMGTELWATKRRLKVVEAVMAKHGVTTDMVEKYVPSEQEKVAWEADRDRFIELTLGSLGNEGTKGMSTDFPKRG